MKLTNQINVKKLFLGHIILILGSFLVACSDDTPAPSESTAGVRLTEMGQQGHFQLTVQSAVKPLPVNEIHSWTIQVMTAEGRKVDDARVMVYGGMPEHKHGFPTKPQVTEKLGNGTYRLEGVKFNMPGKWEIWFNVRAFGKDDKIIFNLGVP